MSYACAIISRRSEVNTWVKMGKAKSSRKKTGKPGDFPKRKNKLGKGKRPAENTTTVSFKSRSIVLPSQLSHAGNRDQPTGKRKLGLEVSVSVRGTVITIALRCTWGLDLEVYLCYRALCGTGKGTLHGIRMKEKDIYYRYFLCSTGSPTAVEPLQILCEIRCTDRSEGTVPGPPTWYSQA